MKIRILGSGYGECKARKKILRDFRRRGGVLVDERLLFDAPADICLAIDDLGFSEFFKTIDSIFISHSHEGHFSPEAIIKLTKRKKMKVYASDDVLRMIPPEANVEKIPVYPFEPVDVDEEYRLIPLPSNHSVEGSTEECFNYVLMGNSTLFYALDGGFINYNAYKFLSGIKLDAVILDAAFCTEESMPKSLEHNSLEFCRIIKAAFVENGIMDSTGKFILSHIPSDKKISVHETLLPKVSELSMTLAYDGYFTTV